MTIYTYHPSDFGKDAPIVLPAPLISGAVFLSGSYPATGNDEVFLVENGISVEELGNVWMVFAWDTTAVSGVVAQAAFTWTGAEVALLALSMEETHPALPIKEFLIQTGCGLFGGRPVVDRRANDAEREPRSDLGFDGYETVPGQRVIH